MKVIDLVAVRESLARLDALAKAHPELTMTENRERLAEALEGMNAETEAAEAADIDEDGEEGRSTPTR
jgi:two-component sensor histidine kinase